MLRPKVRVLLTATGGLAGFSHYNLLKAVNDYEIEVVAADICSGLDHLNYNSFLGFPIHVIPRGEDQAFTKVLLKLAERTNVDVIFPCSSNEVIPFSESVEAFKTKGVVVAVSRSKELLPLMVNKLATYSYLASKESFSDIVPRYYSLEEDELHRAVEALGYPEEPVVFKLKHSQGGRGMFILKGKPGLESWERTWPCLRKEWLWSFPGESLREGFLMEYLSGKEYSVDVLARDGEPLLIIPRERIVISEGKAVLVKLVRHEELIRWTEKLVRLFSLSYIANLQFREDAEGHPKLLEINPRVPGSLAADLAGGINLFEETINLIYTGKVSPKEVRWGAVCGRFFKELFI